MANQIVETIRRLRQKKPFDPFRIVMTTGEKIVILDPSNMAVAQGRLVCLEAVTDRTMMVDFSKLSGVEIFQPLTAD